MCGAGFARLVVQLAINFSPTTNSFFLNMILGGPVCLTKQRERENTYVGHVIKLFLVICTYTHTRVCKRMAETVEN